MSAMDTDDLPVVLSSSTTSGLSLALHPLPILNISEHLTRLKLQSNGTQLPFVLGALLGTQNGREVEIVNTFELAVEENEPEKIDHGFMVARRDQYKQVFPSLEFIGWYSVAPRPTARHIAFHEQFTVYSSTPLLLLLQPSGDAASVDVSAQALPFKAYEPTTEIRDRKSRSVFIEASYTVETGEAERIAVDWTAKGGGGETSLESHLQSQRAAVKMLHDRIMLIIDYVTRTLARQVPVDHSALRAISALVASLPASENPEFRKEFDTEYEDVQITAYLSTFTKAANSLNDLVDKHAVMASNGRDERGGQGGPRRRGNTRPGQLGFGDFERFH